VQQAGFEIQCSSKIFFVKCQSLKVHLHEIFNICFFSISKASSWSRDSYPRLFWKINLNSPRYSNLKLILRIIGRCGKTFFCQARPKNQLFLVGHWSSRTHTYFFWRSIPLKAAKKLIPFKIIWAHSPNMRNQSVHILWICGMNLFVYWDYAEIICMYMENTWNEVNLQTPFRCLYIENTWNESVCILRIRGMNLFIYWE
jgi:hypothetical protein